LMKGSGMKKSIYLYAAAILLVAVFSWFVNMHGNKKHVPKKNLTPSPKVQISETPKPSPAAAIPAPAKQKTSSPSVKYGQISVKATAQNGAPISNALIEIYSDTKLFLPIAASPLETCLTDADGTAEIGSVLNGSFILRTSALTFADDLRRIEVNIGRPQKKVSIRLKPEVQISGSVKKENGEPIAGASIGPLSEEKSGEERGINFSRFVQTDSNGRFIFNGLAPGVFVLNVVIPNFQPVSRTDIDAPSDNIDFTLKGGGATVQGMVVGSRDEKPQSGAGVLMSGDWLNLYTESDANGLFTFRNIPAGRFSLEPILQDRKAGKFDSFECDGSLPVENIILKINQGISLSGKAVYYSNGVPISGILLSAKHQDGASTTTTNESGQFFFEPLIPAPMAEITIISPEYVIFDQMKINEKVFTIEEYMPDSDISDISLQVNKRWTIAGKVENVAPEQTSNYTVFIKSRDKNDEVYATINPDGSFSGSFIGDFNCQAGLYTKSMNLASEIVEFSLELGKPEPFIILTPAQPQVIKGHVLDHTGARLAGCEILAKGAISNLFTKSDTNGEFRLETLEKILQITASSLQYTQKIEKVVDIPFNEELVFQFWMGKILAGIVTTSDEKPVATASIKYEWVDNQSGVHKTNQTYSDIKGRFRITDINNDLAERIYCQPQSAVGTDSAALGEVQIDDVPLPDENFKIILPNTSALRLRVFDENNSPFSGGLNIQFFQKKADTGGFVYFSNFESIAKEGECSISSLTPGTYQISVKTRDERAGFLNAFDFKEDGDEAVIRLRPPTFLKGYVLEKGTNIPVADAAVALSNASESSATNLKQTVNTNQGGEFEILCLDSDRLNLFVSRSGYQTFSQIIHINNGALDVDIPMTVYLAKATASLSGAVINTEGKPESGVSVHARQINVFEESQAQSHSAETTDETGKFMFADVADGDYLVTAEKESLSAAEAVTIKEQQSMSVVLTLKKKVKVYGALKTEQSALFQQPLILVNKLTGNSYITQFTKGGQFEFAVPSGVYKIRIGESELSGEVDISDNVESYELDLEF